MRHFIFLSFALLLLTSCSLEEVSQTQMMDHSMMNENGNLFSTDASGLPPVTDSEIVELKDGEEYLLTAHEVVKELNGKKVRMLAYNGSIPGPTIKVQQGSTIKLLFKNVTDHASSIHSHGIRLKNAFDGSHLVQNPVAPGDTFLYEITFPDPGMYWYHPHLREDYAQELGMYGNYWVVPSDEEYWSPVNREVPLFLDDILLGKNDLIPFSEDASNHALMGRFGNVMLANGSTDYRLEVNQGEVVRFFLTNAANSRTFNITLPGIKMKLVGGDSGVYEKETWVEEVLLSPSERVVLETSFPKSGTFEFTNDTPAGRTVLGKIVVSSKSVNASFDPSFKILRTNVDLIHELKPFTSLMSQEPDKFLQIDLHMDGMGHMMNHEGIEKIEWEDTMPMMNEMSTSDSLTWELEDPKTGKANMEIDDWKFKLGEKVKIRLFNDPSSMHPMQHPIHIHGQRFLVLSINGKPQDNLVWKDTVLVQTGDTVDIVVEMSNPGVWMIHCHIAEHLESRMMMKFEVLQ